MILSFDVDVPICYCFPFQGGDPPERENVKERVIM